ncbi:hypothetical protein ANCCAN_27524 [Ancylostoma caninum]|uniref:Uncharacterized protein n=1 Tax=Ancylostoma caninum TaxID=29170 RepID=A0A368F6T0_ANCCA|nr:hypothetical protein ANCCAN_27524 [Ancylostoma caninum]
MFVAIGFLLGSIVATAGFTAYRNTTLTLGVITIIFKIFVSIVAYVATAKRNGKIMIFAAICGGLASAVSAYLAVTGFTNWANKQFRSDYIPYIAQLIVDILEALVDEIFLAPISKICHIVEPERWPCQRILDYFV